jgi:ATP-dependent Clp protease adaptor protein ClpS
MAQHESKIIIEPKKKIKQNLPKMFKVLLLNDDFTPMEFVVDVIKKVFLKSEDEAMRLMLKIHTEGMAVCGIYPHEIAETKMNQVLKLAKEQQHPLQSIIEKI